MSETGSGARRRRTMGETFSGARTRGSGGIALMPFIPAGYPDLETTTEAIVALEGAGADLIEIGFPFSDPIADGPTIQASYTLALQKQLKLGEVFKAIGQVRAKVALPLVGMASYSLVYRYGLERFIAESKESGLDGLIVPDLPPPEAKGVCDQVRACGLETILLVAPTTSPQRRREIARLSSGFIYYLSVSGITGERDRLPADLVANVRGLKEITDKPVCVGFGISKAEHVKQLSGVADGAIVGSAFVKRMTERAAKGPVAIASALAAYCHELLG